MSKVIDRILDNEKTTLIFKIKTVNPKVQIQKKKPKKQNKTPPITYRIMADHRLKEKEIERKISNCTLLDN